MSDRSQLIETGTPFQFDAERDAEFERLVKRYPTRESMILPALWLTQEQEGWISAEAIGYIADRIGTFASKVFEVATFYTMYNLHPVGEYHICVCRTLSCYLLGKQQIVDYLYQELGIKPGDVSKDGKFSLEEVECLGHCGTAPVVQVNGEFHEDMDVEKMKALLATLK
ncbi:NAD(P)H-dependent oxidoreductase subunit E [Desulfogranum marinum]|jgi:NADH-quinone oxidoreductase subunit E|uniref:NADH-quinone oxidoreductase subunit NuoE family protein n=1 Tax=Desulfogranum marinum TaxID=453220 RepID=UPI00196293B2|nr:NAD(P)H-dependent oxidoreductase subunit E [Desulfogranum marinum]MBM9512564.1 NAD(P)H-dependent oxidoreductase subunit E [Desulfogranum marinum]